MLADHLQAEFVDDCDNGHSDPPAYLTSAFTQICLTRVKWRQLAERLLAAESDDVGSCDGSSS
jgi:hypothetical protein